jgi:O-antigen/teichoic acid export membrane protein
VHKQILGYIPANLVPAIVSFAMIYAYTRLLTPAAFGAYSFVFAVVLVVQTSVYYAIPVAVMRFYPAAEVEGRETAFLREAYALFYAVTAVIVAVCVIALFVIPLSPGETATAWLGLPLLFLRSAIGMNQAVNRSIERMARFNAIECAHACLGFALGLVFIWLVGPRAESVVLGLLVAALICAGVDVRLLVFPLRRRGFRIRRDSVMRLANFAWPLMVAAATAVLLQLSDRFVVGGLGSASMLGIYTVASSLVERPTTLICVSISTATFSMAVQALEQRGHQAGRVQAGKNGAALLAIALPACVGLALTARHIAAVLVGPAFQDGVAILIPIMSFTALFRGVRGHFVDHAFHLAGRPNMMLWSYAPAAAANIAINLLLVPRYGMIAAAWSALGCQAAATMGGWLIGQRVFPLWLPLGAVVRIVLAVLPMAVALWFLDLPLTWLGLMGTVGAGMVVFLAAGLALDVGGARSMLQKAMARQPERVG